ncbi:MAG TPA: response regulator [Vicinamibacterales bacterium]|nr:response regulator [Vicinamibacterales bacterium]
MTYRFGTFELDPDEFRLTRDGRVVPLPPKPFDLLAALVARPGQLVTRDELLRTVWKDTVVEASSLNAAMSVLRQALGPEASPWIETIAGRGYRWRGPASAVAPTLPRLAQGPACRVALVDDHEIVRLGLRTLLAQQPHCAVAGEAGSIEAAALLVAERQPDLLILDLMLGGEPSLPHIRRFAAAAPALRVIVLSMLDEAEWARRALAAGARGYVMKAEMLADLVAAIDTVMSGGIWVSPRIGRAITQDVLEGRPLSPVSGSQAQHERGATRAVAEGDGAPHPLGEPLRDVEPQA